MPGPTRRTPHARRVAQLAIVGGLLAVIGWALIRQWTQVARELGELGGPALALAALAGLAATWCGFLSWRAVLAEVGGAVHYPAAMRIFFVGQLAKYVPGKIWPILTQARLGRDYRVPGRSSAAAAVIVMVITLGTGLLVTAAALPVLGGAVVDRYWWSLLALPVAAVALCPPVLNRVLALAVRLARREPMPAALSWRGVAAAVGWSLLGWLLFGAHLWALLADLGVAAPLLFARAVGAFAGSWAIGFLLAVAPAGVGGREVALVVLLAGTAAQPAALVAALVSRLLLTLVDLVCPAVAVLVGRRAGGRAGAGADDANRVGAEPG